MSEEARTLVNTLSNEEDQLGKWGVESKSKNFLRKSTGISKVSS
jgi:hypothetical protein